jgi:hypothetical protein
MLEQGGAGVTGYLVVHQITAIGDLAEQRVDALMNALLEIESGDNEIADPDLAVSLESGHVDVQMIVEAEDPAQAATKALRVIRTGIHAIGDATPGWETAQGVMRISPTKVLAGA